MRKKSLFLLIAAFVLLLSSRVQAYGFAYWPAPVFLVDRGRLLFTQGYEGLTILDLADGKVLKRYDRSPGLSSQRLAIVDGDIMGFGYNHVFRLDRDTCEALWQADISNATLYDDLLIGENDNNLLGVDIKSGKRRWSVGIGYSPLWLRHGDRIFCLGGGRRHTDRLLCIDAVSGEVLWTRKAGAGEEFWKLACSENQVYVLSQISRDYRQGTFSNTIRTWNHAGEELASLQPDIRDMHIYQYKTDDTSFVVEGVAHPQPRSKEGDFPLLRPETRQPDARERECLDLATEKNTIGFVLPGGGLLIGPAGFRRGSPRRRGYDTWRPSDGRLHYIDAARHWGGTTGYLNMGVRNPLLWATADGDMLLVASVLGQVECLEKTTGRSLWIYVYPTPREDLSNQPWQYGSWKGGFLVDRLRNYEREIAGEGVTGTIPDGEAGSSPFTIILDPQRRNRYEPLHEQGKSLRDHQLLLLLLLFLILIADWLSERGDGLWRSCLRRILHQTRYDLALGIGFVFLLSVVGIAFLNCGGYSASTFWFVLLSLAVVTGHFARKAYLSHKYRNDSRFSQASLLPPGLLLLLASILTIFPAW